MVPIAIEYPDESDPGPFPVPPNPKIEDGSDSHLLIVDKDHCILYEMFYATQQPDGTWWASSTAKWSLLSNALRPSGWTSTDAAGLPIASGILRYDEVAAGQVNHALRFTAPRTQRLYIWPARHFASYNTDPTLPPMGQKFRLKASFDISPYPPRVQTILRAMKTYGLILADNGLPWEMQFELDSRWDTTELDTLRGIAGANLEAVDESGLMIDPDSGQAAQPGVPTVTVSPGSANLLSGASQQFTASVNGSGLGVTWTVSPPAGVITATGFYTAPATITSMQSVTVTATLTDGSAAGKASVTLLPAPLPTVASVSVSPASVVGGTNISVSVALTGAAPAGGAGITLSGSNPAFAATTVTVPAGTAFQTFSVPTSRVLGVSTVNIIATYNNSMQTSSVLTLSPIPAAFITPVGGPQTQPVGGTFTNMVQVLLRDANMNPTPGIPVTFTAPGAGASAVLSSQTVISNSAGVASVAATANGITGTYNITAATGSLTTALTLTNSAMPGGSNLAKGKPALQSSTLTGYGPCAASAAVDGNTDGNFLSGSVSHTDENSYPWWQVDLGASASISAISIWNRTDCCSDRLSDYWVFVSDTPFNATDTPATLQSRAGTWSSHLTSIPAPFSAIVPNSGGRYVRVQLNYHGFLALGEVQVLGTAGTPANLGTDLAQGKNASQSSTLSGYGNSAAAAAVDGNTDGNFNNGSVSHTNSDANAWWQVDLGTSAAISTIVVWNRTDCCLDRLSDYWVFVSDTPFNATDTPATLQSRAGTWSSHQTLIPTPSTTITLSAQGRYVRVQLSGAGFLNLAEVQVYGGNPAPPSNPTNPTGTNLAQGKPTSQSSTLFGYGYSAAAAAVDGNTDGNFYHGSVSHTDFDANPWWQVDLGASASITSVVVYNRTDCCSDRLSDYWVFVSDTPFNATDTPATLQGRAGTWSSHQTTYPTSSATIPFTATGRYVRVQLSGASYLQLAEVQVIGTANPVVVTGTNVAAGKPAVQSSTIVGYGSALASAAVDGNTDGNFYDGSVSHTNYDANAWWQVDLGATPTISSVVIFNRTDAAGDRLGDYWVFVSNTPFGATDTPSTLQGRPGTWSSHQIGAPSPSVSIPVGTQGRYVRVQLSGTNYLQLAEVQVFGQ